MLKTVLKTIVLVFVFTVTIGIDTAISPIIMNSLAMQQMNNSIDSSMWIQMYQYFSNYKFLVMLAIALVTYANEIETLVLKFKK